MSSISKPIFVCLHGTWHSSSCWDKIKALLTTHGYTYICPTLPSTRATTLINDFTEYMHAIRLAVTELVEAKKEVIVVTHSYSGISEGQTLEEMTRRLVQRGAAKGV